jgi:hypothetical protein
VDKSVNPDSATILEKTIWFSCVHTQRLLNKSISRVHKTHLKIKRLGMDSRLSKPYKSCLGAGTEKRKRKKKKNL